MKTPALLMRTALNAFALLSISALASAEEAQNGPALTGNVTLASEYLFRGIAQTNHKPAIQGGFDFALPSGLYAGSWASNISWLSDAGAGRVSAPLEWDFYSGYKGTIGDVGYDLGLLEYYYPGEYPDGMTSPNTLEAYAAASWKWLTFKGSYSLTNLFGATTPDGDKTRGSYYLDASANYPLAQGLTLIGHAGYQSVRHFSDASYADYKIGASADVSRLSFALFYSGTTAKGDAGQFYHSAFDKNLGKGRILLTVSKAL